MPIDKNDKMILKNVNYHLSEVFYRPMKLRILKISIVTLGIAEKRIAYRLKPTNAINRMIDIQIFREVSNFGRIE
jgi:hypothetical protein